MIFIALDLVTSLAFTALKSLSLKEAPLKDDQLELQNFDSFSSQL